MVAVRYAGSRVRKLLGLLCAALPGLAVAQAKPALVHSVDVQLPPPLVVGMPQYVTVGGSGYTARLVGSTKTNSVTCDIVNNGTISDPAGSNGNFTFSVGQRAELVVFSCSQSDGINVSPPAFFTTTAVAPVTSPVISAPASVLAGAVGITASTQACPNCTYVWTISNGTLTNPGGSAGVTAYGANSITFTAGDRGSLTLNLTVVGPDNSQASNSANIGVN